MITERLFPLKQQWGGGGGVDEFSYSEISLMGRIDGQFMVLGVGLSEEIITG